jgi:hypothetical protein
VRQDVSVGLDRRRTWIVVAGAVALSVFMRLRMFWSPVSVDEGGYLAIARAWGHGRVLYRDVFVDRPQGLLVLFRVWDWLSGGSTASIRVMAMLFGALLVVSTGVIVRELVGDSAARSAVIICAVVSAAPVLEGYTANGEILSGAVAAAGLAIGVVAISRQRRLLWFFGSGLLGGVALSLKQSGFDGLLPLAVWLALGVLFCASERERALKAIGALTAGVVTIVGLLMLHGALTGWSRWWAAVAGYRLHTQSAFSSADWQNLVVTVPYAAVVLGASVLLAFVGLRGTARGVRRARLVVSAPGPVLLELWLVSAAVAFLIGGGFWRHYWLLLTAPVSALAGAGLAQLPKFRRITLAAALAPCLVITVWVYAGDQAHINIRAASDRRAATDEVVAYWFATHREAGESLYALCGSAAVYADAHQDPGYPYLWAADVAQTPNALRRLIAYLSDPKLGPNFIAEYQTPSFCDRSGRVSRILRASYQKVAVLGRVVMYERNLDETTPPAAPVDTTTPSPTACPTKQTGRTSSPPRKSSHARSCVGVARSRAHVDKTSGSRGL